MNARDVIRNSIECAQSVVDGYLADLTDADLLKRPAPTANHIAWQLGHLIKSENEMVNMCFPGSMPPLPPGFSEKYTKDTAKLDAPSAFHTKAEYLRILAQQRSGTLRMLDTQSDTDLDKPAPEPFQSFVKTIGALFNMQGLHWLMHVGQWVVVRRNLGRPPLF